MLRLSVAIASGSFVVDVDGEVDSVVSILTRGDVDPVMTGPPYVEVGASAATLLFDGAGAAFELTWTPAEPGASARSWAQMDELYWHHWGPSRRWLHVCLGCEHSGDDSHLEAGILTVDQLMPDGTIARVATVTTPVQASPPPKLEVLPPGTSIVDFAPEFVPASSIRPWQRASARSPARPTAPPTARSSEDGWVVTPAAGVLALVIVAAGFGVRAILRRSRVAVP